MSSGDGVYRARSLSAIYSNTRFNDDTICTLALQQYSSKRKGIDNNEFYVFPNPVSDFLNVIVNNINSPVPIKTSIYDILGQTYYLDKKISEDGLIVLPVHSLKPGIYFMEIQLPDGHLTKHKFIKL